MFPLAPFQVIALSAFPQAIPSGAVEGVTVFFAVNFATLAVTFIIPEVAFGNLIVFISPLASGNVMVYIPSASFSRMAYFPTLMPVALPFTYSSLSFTSTVSPN